MAVIEVRDLGRAQLAEAAQVVGRGMRDNPLHQLAFGDDDERRERALIRFFRPVLHQYLRKGTVLGAFEGKQLVGVCGMVRPGRCQPTLVERIRLVPSVVRAAPLRRVARILRWTAEWRRRDPRRGHWHLGPVAVDREHQGRGVGTQLLHEFCRRVDSLGALAYLETDSAPAVALYERHDFETMAMSSVLGVPNWYMVRSGRSRRSLW